MESLSGKYNRPIFLILLFLAIIVAAAVLKITSSVIIPLTLAILVSLVFEPIISTLNSKFKIPWILGILIMVTFTAICIFGISGLIITSLRTIIDLYPKYEERFMIIYKKLAELLKLPFDAENSLFENLWGQLGVRSAVQSMALTLSSGLVNFVKDFLMICLFSIFLLLELRDFQTKLEIAFAHKAKGRIGPMISDIISQVSHYISIKFYVSLFTGIIVWLGCLIIGLDFPIIWGFLAFIANFIPNFGSIFSSVITVIFALLQFWPSPGPVVATACVMIGVNMIIGNIVEPRIQGQNLGLSPFVIIASLSIWGWIWGFTGMVIAVPIMVILKIICENVSFLHSFSTLMGNKVDKNKKTKLPAEDSSV